MNIPSLDASEPPPLCSVDRIGSKTRDFYQRHFPQASDKEVNSWKWQLKNRVTTLDQLKKFVTLSEDELAAFELTRATLPLAITPYYLSLVNPTDPDQPLRKAIIPTRHEFIQSPGEAEDPLNEDADSPVPGLVHRYPDRVLFLATNFCSSYCRYCTRSRLVGTSHSAQAGCLHDYWKTCIDYIRAHPEVRDVLVSGGDPLTMEDQQIEYLLTQLRSIPHVEMIRMGTKVPVVLPQRITPKLCRILKKFHPLYLSIHFTHPDELTPETSRACNLLADAGIPLGSQTVLLAGVNDNIPTMKSLMQGLLKIRVKPYYIYQCDAILGSRHFRTSLKKGLSIIRGIQGFTTGYAVPHFVIDAPGGGGKIPLLPEYVVERKGNDVVLKNFRGDIYHYLDEAAEQQGS